jgi:hypothetical protein
VAWCRVCGSGRAPSAVSAASNIVSYSSMQHSILHILRILRTVCGERDELFEAAHCPGRQTPLRGPRARTKYAMRKSVCCDSEGDVNAPGGPGRRSAFFASRPSTPRLALFEESWGEGRVITCTPLQPSRKHDRR